MKPIYDQGSDSLEIRIWINYSLAIDNHVFLFSKHNGKWSGQLIEYKLENEYDRDSITRGSEFVTKITPTSGWDSFMERLNEIGVMKVVNDESGGADGTSYCIEVASTSNYIFARRWSPEGDAVSNLESKRLVYILELIEKEFNFKRIQQ